ncbi:tRNA preQ1(34) S-adenosylmethionine ribosyltransferase-isomerase QueA [Aetokthonos hydrillicola Thurmond2011]|jgi:S-adenosylmethionine:tRNA ribosyltransferase-isomerase|uniref:S-adenosylmethionine:tRNA ribosyltransferase-isomerase n=1 Tax=Aetokthonos hydrillicola Thurmond2011 TaxID=2712845 RepID=A0AAP5M8M8_9CYAN|nr:tRNA preQ1(34) S-adenosylmethionine ribosyltransferase-isomerase QueA [Aetokthonos hydrillicola]MBO3463507.1 tRNA preQ1(34) S-adenosylmethionine ribosyltransferase-isomerase QueA [Aetokthonos hydrillicola CCALA 1050]MBW4590060.1 tRNA preQ1(34) S-adenosylmethionine ribosyltransferase-isomerase QueA [Aetokthonos hydrillicola CCALA 1050]MDR9894887.1 tRNA preQ1(34) S-adenosylmethionine ribosyltransferase-isomerase QueA [Aetokthonos hydrillicola Thurmond2011]
MEQPLITYNLSATSDLGKNEDHSLDGYNYDLPQELIAQNPLVPRDSSRLLVVNSTDEGKQILPQHNIFRDLPDVLRPKDLLVMNNTQVIPARLYGRKSTGAEIEVLLLEDRLDNCWLALVKPGKRFKRGAKIIFEPRGGVAGKEFPPSLTATVMETDKTTGGRLLKFDVPEGLSLVELLEVFGVVPLPPYITSSNADSQQYQTVYAKHPGAIAAPTAGLHFTPELLQKLRDRGINQSFITLHVGLGTFRPLEVENVTTHKMHQEWISVSSSTVEMIRATKAAGGRVIAVGTTVARALEGAAQSGELQPFCGLTDLFIYPGYQWRVVEGLITNFHLPRSSLLMLVSALIGRQNLLNIYQEAIKARYRFYSFGDAMLILP